MLTRKKIYSYTQQEYASALFDLLGKGRLHARQLYQFWMKRGTLDGWTIEPQASELVEQLRALTDFSLPALVMKKGDPAALKFLLDMGNGLTSESVFLPMKRSATLCISSQVGCRMGCAFCETGRMGLKRHLTADEIVSQVLVARHCLGLDVRNIVFMGMGEPLDNFDEVMRAVEVLTDPAGLAFGPSRITISTSGRVDGILQLIDRADPALNLAVSVNAPNDAIRQKIMPINRKWNMASLKEAMRKYCLHPRREIFAEYVLLQGINDSLECADELADYLKDLRVKVNLIPYNPQSNDRYAPPDPAVQDAFLERMRERGFLTLLRQTKGRQIMAACGQLGSLPAKPIEGVSNSMFTKPNSIG